MKRDKNIAGILALFFGWLGVHRYYLGQNDRGLVYTLSSGFILWVARVPIMGLLIKFLWIPFIMIVSLIDAITLFAMDKRVFDEKYNDIPRTAHQDVRENRRQTRRKTGRETRQETQREHREARRKRREYQPKTTKRRASPRNNPYKKRGVEKFNDFDYAEAIAEFKKSLDIAPNDIASHFNIACAYSLTEDSNLAFHHLDTAVSLGFKDFDKIKNHHALAFLRVQDAFEEFEENGYRLRKKTTPAEQPDENLLNTQPDLLDQLKKLGELRNKGLLTELEFEQQKKKLLG